MNGYNGLFGGLGNLGQLLGQMTGTGNNYSRNITWKVYNQPIHATVPYPMTTPEKPANEKWLDQRINELRVAL